MSPILAHREVRPSGDGRDAAGEEAGPDAWIWFLHGIFGAGRNWRSVARRLAGRRPSWGGLLVDLRLHGTSQGFDPPHTLEACADDLEALWRGPAAAPTALLGHSFGGKVALEAARRRPPGLRQLWVVDATPSPRKPGGQAVHMLDTVRELSGPFGSREEAAQALVGEGFARPVARWMATNLEERDGAWGWALDVEALEALLLDFFRRDLWEVVESPPGGLDVHLVKAEDSEVLTEEECRRVESAAADHGRAHLHRLPGGHWLNVSNPDGLLELLAGRLP